MKLIRTERKNFFSKDWFAKWRIKKFNIPIVCYLVNLLRMDRMDSTYIVVEYLVEFVCCEKKI